MDRIALFTTECTQLSAPMRELILANREKIAVVVTSEVGARDPIKAIREGITHGRRSGPEFTKYLFFSFTAYFWFARYDRLRSTLTGEPRRCVTVAELCRELEIPNIHTPDVNSPETVQALRDADLDFIVIYWFDQIIYEELIELPRKAVVNFHAAYLPDCRGLFPVFFSALYNDGVYGVSAHEIINREIDAGPLLAQLRVELDSDRSALYRDVLVNRAGVEFATEVMENFDAYREARFTPQEPGSYHSYPTPAEVARARALGMPMSTVKDFLELCRAGLQLPAMAVTAASRLPRPVR